MCVCVCVCVCVCARVNNNVDRSIVGHMTYILYSDILSPVQSPAARKCVQVPEDTVSRGDGQETLARGVYGERLHCCLVTQQGCNELTCTWEEEGEREGGREGGRGREGERERGRERESLDNPNPSSARDSPTSIHLTE